MIAHRSGAGSGRRPGALLRRLLAAIVATAGTLLLVSSTAQAAPTGAPADTSAAATASTPMFGPLLNWASDNAQAYAQRLGATPGLYGETLGYPLQSADESELAGVAEAAAAQGAEVLLQLDPRVPLATLTKEQANSLADQIQQLTTSRGTHFLIDFAPDMNGSWTPWGQQPRTFVSAFQTVAAAIHHTVPSAGMVWAPAAGAGYPFDTSRGAVRPSGPRVTSQLDTNGDGVFDETHDPYGRYWPGAAAVERVGLSVFWYGPTGHLGVNARPPANWLSQSLTGQVGYSTPTGAGRDFVQRFSVSQHKPMLLETGALFVPSGAPGPGQAAIEQDWIGQVFAPSLRAQFPSIDSVLWLEQQRPEAEAAGALVDWRVTQTPAAATGLRSALTAAGFALGPVPAQGGRRQADAAVAQAYQPPGSNDDQSDRILAGLLVLLGFFLIAGLAGRFRPRWRYPETAAPGDPRDTRIDLLRGFVIASVVVTHIEVGGPWSWFALRAGALSGAEAFVLLSGIVLGSMYPRLVAKFGEWSAAKSMLRRATRLYVATIAVILAVFFLSKIPGLKSTSVTTFTDLGTGAGGERAAGRVYYLYGTAQHLLDYPPPFFALRDLLLLRYGPWPINIMGLFVVLSLAVPAAMWLVRRGLWWVLLAVSWGLYALNALHPVQLVDAQFEAVFPLFAWQVAFAHGLVIGRYRARITAALTTRVAKVSIAVGLAAYIVVLLVLRSGVHLRGLPSYDSLYTALYERTNLGGGRLVDLALATITIYALLTTCWRPLHSTIGRFFEPLGHRSLEVFLIQVFLVLAVGNIPHLDHKSAWQGFVVQTVALALIWLIVRDRAPRPEAPVAAPADVATRIPEMADSA